MTDEEKSRCQACRADAAVWTVERAVIGGYEMMLCSNYVLCNARVRRTER